MFEQAQHGRGVQQLYSFLYWLVIAAVVLLAPAGVAWCHDTSGARRRGDTEMTPDATHLKVFIIIDCAQRLC